MGESRPCRRPAHPFSQFSGTDADIPCEYLRTPTRMCEKQAVSGDAEEERADNGTP